MKKKLVIALAVVVAVGGVTVGSIAMNNGTDEQKPDKKVEVVSNKDNTEEQVEESGTDKEDVLPEADVEEQVENDKTSVGSEEKADKKDSKTEKKSEKKDGKSSKKSDVQKVSSTASPSVNKPSQPSSKPNKPNGNTNASKPSKPSHTHNWVASTKKVYHDAVGHNEKVKVKDAWTEKIPRYKDVPINVCNGCGQNITGFESKHNKEHALAGEKGGWHLEYKKEFSHYEEVYHEAQYQNKWVVDKPAWTETVVTGYSCSCGAKK